MVPTCTNVTLHQPFVVFDAGIGSYLIADMVRRRYPSQDVLYIADRGSFPYGDKNPHELLRCVQRVIDISLTADPAAIVVASNAPTLMVFDRLSVPEQVSLRGVYPPVRQALQLSKSKRVIVLGVKSLIESDAFKSFVSAERGAGEAMGDVLGINASPLVEFVESGAFLSRPVFTQEQIEAFVLNVRQRAPAADVYTLSSTHLPWLRPFLEHAAPDIAFLDPAQAIVESLGNITTRGSGKLVTWLTQSRSYPAADFADLIARLRLDMSFTIVDLDKSSAK